MAALHKMASAVLQVVIVVTLLLSPYPVSCVYNNVPLCPVENQCTCTLGDRDYKVECRIPAMEVHYIDDYSYITCGNEMVASDYAKLPTISIPNNPDGAKTFSFTRCPLPDVPLVNVIEKLGYPKGSNKLKNVFFQSQGKNLSKSLSRHHFKGLESITRLVLSGNGITDVPENLFIDLKNLTWLDLRSNSVILKPNLFEPLSNLSVLELGQNKISELPKGLFKHLSNLTQLNLWQNNLRNLSGDIFDGLNSLKSLDLSTNNLVSLPSDVFHKLPNLRNVNLLSNNFSSLPPDLFSRNPYLELLRLVENKQTLHELPGGLLSNLTKMKVLTLTRCRIEKLSDSVFWGSMNLVDISFEGNNIEKIQYNLFRDQMNLETLNFDKNKITNIEDGAFRTLKNLQVLNLSNNRLHKLSNLLFNHMDSLETLLIQHNNLQYISYKAFFSTEKLEFIDMSYNSLSLMDVSENSEFSKTDAIGLRSPFQFLTKLKHLNLSHNNITEIFADWRLNLLVLNLLDLTHNKFMKLSFPDVSFIANRLLVDLRNNNISEVEFKDALAVKGDTYPDAYHSGTKPAINRTILIDNNPLHCDCTMYHFSLYLHDKLDPQVRSSVNVLPGNVTCNSPENLEGRLLSNIRPQELVCPLDFPQSQFDPQCPDGCSCHVRPYDISLILNCSDSNNYETPRIPDAKFLGLKQTELHYENNKLIDLEGLSKNQKSYSQITRLFVGGNNISTMSPNDIPRVIETLDLRMNHLQIMNKSVTDFLSNSTTLQQLWISGNPFKCICDNHDFFSFLQLNYIKIKDFNNVTCSNGQKISSLKLGDLCGTSPMLIAISIIVALTGLFLGILTGLYYKYHLEIKVYLYSKNIWWGKEPDDDKLYDAFISYSHKDEEFITKTIVPRLEDTDNYKLCLHYRNWVPGEFIPTQIASSVEQSRRTLVVLSPNFLESVWGRMEFRTAHQRALKEGRARVVVVLYGDIGPTDNLDPELKAYLSMNTYVKWGDPWFWDKLRYALPHRKRSKNNTPAHAMLKKKGFDDKLELIHPTTPGTPPGQNTPPAHQAHSNPLMNHVNAYPNGVNGIKPPNLSNGTITMNGLRVNGNARHSDV